MQTDYQPIGINLSETYKTWFWLDIIAIGHGHVIYHRRFKMVSSYVSLSEEKQT